MRCLRCIWERQQLTLMRQSPGSLFRARLQTSSGSCLCNMATGNTGGALRGALKKPSAPRRVTARMQRRCGRVFQLMMDEICGGDAKLFAECFTRFVKSQGGVQPALSRRVRPALSRSARRPAKVPDAARPQPVNSRPVSSRRASSRRRNTMSRSRSLSRPKPGRPGTAYSRTGTDVDKRKSVAQALATSVSSKKLSELQRAMRAYKNNPTEHSRRRLERAKAAVEGKHFAPRPTELNPMGAVVGIDNAPTRFR